MHLHHRLLALGHSHRRAVLVMYFWAALLSFGAIGLSISGGTAELVLAIGLLLVVGVVVVLSPRARRAAREARAAALAAQRSRSRADHPSSRARRTPPTPAPPPPVPAAPADGPTAVPGAREVAR
jgi:UDP-GlcNAc:undecaprenyl-phosphate GlcNAc-1-phosphate transferase